MGGEVVGSLEDFRRRLAGAEGYARVFQGSINPRCERMRATEHAPRGPFRGLERGHGLAEIVERGGGVVASTAWSPSGRPTYVFQQAHPSAHATTPW